MLQHNLTLNIWSAGCSNGAEVYSVAIILNRLSPYRTHRILATDIDSNILSQAIAGGPYKASEIRNVPKDQVDKYFNAVNDAFWIKNDIRKKVIFKEQDLTRDPFEDNFDLIICRNVVIYFSDEIKKNAPEEIPGCIENQWYLIYRCYRDYAGCQRPEIPAYLPLFLSKNRRYG